MTCHFHSTLFVDAICMIGDEGLRALAWLLINAILQIAFRSSRGTELETAMHTVYLVLSGVYACLLC